MEIIREPITFEGNIRERTIRELTEERECQILSPYAAKAIDSKGRDLDEPECDLRTVYQRDRDRILHCKSFRRLKHKTQVFLSPLGDHYRDRLTHTLEVSQIARSIAGALSLNEPLTEAIALGHDLGHTPFGHAGERVLNRINPEGFIHCEQSVRVVEVLEKKGAGLNLTKEVRDGILNHRSSGHPSTLEGRAVQLADKIAYVNHDIDDAERAGILREEDLPEECRRILGNSTKERLNRIIRDIVYQSQGLNELKQSEDMQWALQHLRKFMFSSVYTNPVAKSQEGKAERVVQELYEYYIEHPESLPEEYLVMIFGRGEGVDRIVTDYISGMTDQYAMSKYQDLFIPKAWQF